MPNWAHNKLRVIGDIDDLTEFAKAVKGDEQPLSFETICPTPPELLEGDSWHAWRIGGFSTLTDDVYGWGTKWDASFGEANIRFYTTEPGDDDAEPKSGAVAYELGDGTTEILYEFDTAWSPPVNFVVQASAMFPQLRFVLDYAETGMDVAGKLIIAEGKVIEDLELEVDDVLGDSEKWF